MTKGRRKIYKILRISMKLPVLCKEDKRVKTRVEEELERESEAVLTFLLIFVHWREIERLASDAKPERKEQLQIRR